MVGRGGGGVGSEDEVRDGGSAKLSYCSEREGVTNNNDLGRRNPWRSGRQEDEPIGQLTINKICTDEADYINAFFTRLQREEVSSILAMSTRPAPCGSPAVTIASAMRGGSASPGVQTLVTRPWRSFITRHGGARGRRRGGNPLGERRRPPRGRSPILLPLN